MFCILLNKIFFFSSLKANCFSVLDSPIWMDSSTQSYCENVENKIGGPQVFIFIFQKEIVISNLFLLIFN